MSRHERVKAPPPRSQAEWANEIAQIGALDAAALRALWPAWFARPAPRRMQRATLSLALAHRIQSATLGGLSKVSGKTLDSIAAKEFGAATVGAVNPPRRLKTGTKLVREWHGVVYEVAVVEDGFVWNGTRYRSLSAIARAITGTHWNGLVFFGLKAASASKMRSSAASAYAAEAPDA